MNLEKKACLLAMKQNWETMSKEQGPNDIVFHLYILPCLKPLHFSFSWGNKSPFYLGQFRSGFLLLGAES